MHSPWSPRCHRPAAILVGLALALFPLPAAGAAAPAAPVDPGPATLADPESCPSEFGPLALAQAREAQAGDAMREGDDLERAAELLEEAGTLRSRCDLRGFEDLRLAARLFGHAGRIGKARDVMLRAAEAAVWTGNVLAAAHAYVDAAVLAARSDRKEVARDAVARARALSASPLLAPRQRVSILNRLLEGEDELALR